MSNRKSGKTKGPDQPQMVNEKTARDLVRVLWLYVFEAAHKAAEQVNTTEDYKAFSRVFGTVGVGELASESWTTMQVIIDQYGDLPLNKGNQGLYSRQFGRESYNATSNGNAVKIAAPWGSTFKDIKAEARALGLKLDTLVRGLAHDRRTINEKKALLARIEVVGKSHGYRNASWETDTVSSGKGKDAAKVVVRPKKGEHVYWPWHAEGQRQVMEAEATLRRHQAEISKLNGAPSRKDAQAQTWEDAKGNLLRLCSAYRDMVSRLNERPQVEVALAELKAAHAAANSKQKGSITKQVESQEARLAELSVPNRFPADAVIGVLQMAERALQPEVLAQSEKAEPVVVSIRTELYQVGRGKFRDAVERMATLAGKMAERIQILEARKVAEEEQARRAREEARKVADMARRAPFLKGKPNLHHPGLRMFMADVVTFAGHYFHRATSLDFMLKTFGSQKDDRLNYDAIIFLGVVVDAIPNRKGGASAALRQRIVAYLGKYQGKEDAIKFLEPLFRVGCKVRSGENGAYAIPVFGDEHVKFAFQRKQKDVSYLPARPSKVEAPDAAFGTLERVLSSMTGLKGSGVMERLPERSDAPQWNRLKGALNSVLYKVFHSVEKDKVRTFVVWAIRTIGAAPEKTKARKALIKALELGLMVNTAFPEGVHLQFDTASFRGAFAPTPLPALEPAVEVVMTVGPISEPQSRIPEGEAIVVVEKGDGRTVPSDHLIPIPGIDTLVAGTEEVTVINESGAMDGADSINEARLNESVESAPEVPPNTAEEERVIDQVSLQTVDSDVNGLEGTEEVTVINESGAMDGARLGSGGEVRRDQTAAELLEAAEAERAMAVLLEARAELRRRQEAAVEAELIDAAGREATVQIKQRLVNRQARRIADLDMRRKATMNEWSNALKGDMPQVITDELKVTYDELKAELAAARAKLIELEDARDDRFSAVLARRAGDGDIAIGAASGIYQH